MNEVVLDYLPVERRFYAELLSTKDLSSLPGWPRAFDHSWFLGGQIFRIGNVDFTTDYPMLGFARHLKAVCSHLARNPEQSYTYFDEAGWEVNRELIFFCAGDEVVVRQGTLIGDAKILASARASLHELNVKSSVYLNRVFEYCCELVPHLSHRDDVRDWLNDLTHVTPLECDLTAQDRTKDLYRRP